MTPQLTEAEYVDGYRVSIRFKDGTSGVIDLEDELSWGEVFVPLQHIAQFKQLRFDAELNTIVWPTGADLAPEYLYERALAAQEKASSI